MNYPLISEYIEAIKLAEDNFDELSYLRPVLDDDGLPVMTSGNFAVVFKMEDEQSGKFYAVKCFTKEQKGRAEAYREITKELNDVSSPYLVSIRYLDKDLFVDTGQTTETEFPVLLMDWVDGKTLDKYLRENLDDKYALEMLAYRFSQLAQWLIPQPFAHGDLKPDNILVREDGSLVLVDYDGMYVPAMKGQKARELGSPDFRHPQRTDNNFDEHIDDFPIISILLSLKSICLFPQLLKELGNSNGLLLSEDDYQDISTCKLIKKVFPSGNTELNNIIASYVLCLGGAMVNSLSYLNLECPEHYYSTSVTEDDIRLAIEIDDILYSRDKRKLLRRKDDINASRDKCHIIEGTEIICDYAFKMEEFGVPDTIWLPKSIIKVGKDVFTTKYLPGISEIVVPKGYEQKYSQLMPQYKHLISCFTTKVSSKDIEDGIKDNEGIIYSKDGYRLLECSNSVNIEKVVIREGTKVICDGAFHGELIHDDYRSCHIESILKKVLIPNSVEIIGQDVFSHCCSLKSIMLPNSLKRIYCGAFWRSSIEEIIIPKSVEFIGDLAFSGCMELKRIRFEGYTIIQSQGVFIETNLNVIEIPKGSRAQYEHYLPNLKEKFVEIDSEFDALITTVTVKDSTHEWTDELGVTYSNDKTKLLYGPQETYLPYNLKDYDIRKGTKVICDRAFDWGLAGVMKFGNIRIPETVTHIGDYAFGCQLLESITIPNTVVFIGKNPFAGCERLKKIECLSDSFVVSDNVLYSSDMKQLIYYGYKGDTFVVPNKVESIGESAFEFCDSLVQITLPSTINTIGTSAFGFCKSLKIVIIHCSALDIGYCAFEACESLEYIYIPAGFKTEFEQMLPSLKEKLREINSFEIPNLDSIYD